MKISKIRIKGYLGIDEFSYTPESINVFKGKNGSGKTSIIEAIENGFNSKPKRRTETIKHGEDEATIFIETDNHITIDRRLRNDKADYLKVTGDDANIQSTEGQLKSFFSGSIFRPLDFISLSAKKQTEEILNTIDIPFSVDNFKKWFGSEDVLTGINTDKHVLMILKEIETNHFNTRQDVNREIKTLEHQALGIEKELPDNYDGDDWINVDLKELYNKVSEAEEKNRYIEKGNDFIQNYQDKIKSVDENFNIKQKAVDYKYKDLESDLCSIIAISKDSITDLKNRIENRSKELENQLESIENEYQREHMELKKKYDAKKETAKEISKDLKDQCLEAINQHETKIKVKESEILSLDEKKSLELDSLSREKENLVQSEKTLLGKWEKYLEDSELCDVETIKKEADNAEFMKSHLREWDRIKEIREVKIAEKSRYSSKLTDIIEAARSLPSTLLKQHKLPVDGIAIDENGLIRINGTLLDGLSDGEKLDAALRIAHYKMGELRILCLDKFEGLDPSKQKKVIEFCESNNLQAFITIPDDSDQVTYSNHL